MSKQEVLNHIELILESIYLIQNRFAQIQEQNDLVISPEGLTILDAISMRLQVIGESVKRIQNIDPALFENYQEINWNKIAKFRDLVSHHYENVDHEIVYDICQNHIPKLLDIVNKIQAKLTGPI